MSFEADESHNSQYGESYGDDNAEKDVADVYQRFEAVRAGENMVR
jgi:hypothetical protein